MQKLINSSGPIEDPSPATRASKSLVLGDGGQLSCNATSNLITRSSCCFSNNDMDQHLLSLLKVCYNQPYIVQNFFLSPSPKILVRLFSNSEKNLVHKKGFDFPDNSNANTKIEKSCALKLTSLGSLLHFAACFDL